MFLVICKNVFFYVWQSMVDRGLQMMQVRLCALIAGECAWWWWCVKNGLVIVWQSAAVMQGTSRTHTHTHTHTRIYVHI